MNFLFRNAFESHEASFKGVFCIGMRDVRHRLCDLRQLIAPLSIFGATIRVARGTLNIIGPITSRTRREEVEWPVRQGFPNSPRQPGPDIARGFLHPGTYLARCNNRFCVRWDVDGLTWQGETCGRNQVVVNCATRDEEKI